MAEFTRQNQPTSGRGGPRQGAGRKASVAKRTAQELFGAVSDADWRAIIAEAVSEAKEGGKEGAAARVWLADRAFGKVPVEGVLEEQEKLRGEVEAFQRTVLAALADCPGELRAAVLNKLTQEE